MEEKEVTEFALAVPMIVKRHKAQRKRPDNELLKEYLTLHYTNSPEDK